jgi:Flp pilus assembly protein TadG
MENKSIEFSSMESGQSLLELAMTMAFLLILLAGVVDLGRAFFTYISLRDSAQEGAIYGAYSPTDCTGILQRVKDTSNQPFDISSANVSIIVGTTDCSVTTPDPCAGDQVKVTVTYENFPITMPFIGTMIGRQEIPISASIKDTVISPVCASSPYPPPYP